jgi:hypothetical protein
VSRETFERIIGRAAIDPQFRRRMIEDPEVAFEEYDLTAEQLSALKTISADALEKFAHQLMESIGKDLAKS